jgi:GNAT superfamily N-acetyltransferase
MLDSFYSLDVIARQIKKSEQTYLLLFAGDAPVGFAAFSPRPENPDVYKLHKIYCLVETKGLGYGKVLIEEVERRVLAAGKHILELNVNRHNPALGFYIHLGFSIVYEEDIDIGHGYYMNDYVMRKELA